MAMAACPRFRPLNRLLVRAFRCARENRGLNVAKRHFSLLDIHGLSFVQRSASSSAHLPSSHGRDSGDLQSKLSGYSRAFSSGGNDLSKTKVLPNGIEIVVQVLEVLQFPITTGEPAHEKINMPALSPTMTQGNVVQWKKKEGDKVVAGDVLCEIETDKATLDLEAMEDGFLAKIIAPAGAKDIPVGQPLCIMVEDGEDVGKFANFSGASEGAPPTKSEGKRASSVTEEEGSASVTSSPIPTPDVPHQNIAMPALSPTMTQGNVLKWKKQEGEKVTAGDVLCEIETDKASLDMEAMEDGYLAKILVQAGSKDIPVGQPLCIVVEEEGDVDKFKNYTGQATTKTESKKVETDVQAKSLASLPQSGPKKSRVGPSVRRYLAESGLDSTSLEGTGPHGMLLKGDILAAMKSGPPKAKKTSTGSAASPISDVPKSPQKQAETPSSESSFTDIPNSQIRKIIAKRLLESKTQIPHLYLSADATLDSILALRKNWKEKFGTSISVNDFVIRATALALKEVPEANAFWDPKAETIVLHKSIDISVAVATDKGLMTPIVKDANQKSLTAISSEVKSLAERARTGKLKPNEFQGGTFSISNLGMYAVDRFSAIINPPQAGILAVGRGVKCVELAKDADVPVVVTKMGLTLSADNRVIDVEVGGRFLKALATNLSDPKMMLLL